MRSSRSGGTIQGTLVFAFAFLFLAAACTGSKSPTPTTSGGQTVEHATLLLPFLNELDAAQYYFAQDFGYFQQCGLNVDLKPGAGVQNPGAALLEGKVDFAVMDPLTYISGLARGLPYIAISEDTAVSGMSYVSLAQTGITSPQDLPGHIVGLQPGSDNLWYLQKIMNDTLTPQQQAQVHIVPGGYTIKPLLEHKIDVYSLWTNSTDLVSLELQGFKFNVITARGYGIQAMGDVIVVSQKTLQDNPGLVARLQAAVSGGLLQETTQNGQLAIQSTEARLSHPVSKAVLQAEWPKVIELQQSTVWAQNGMGSNDPAAYGQVQNFLFDNGKITTTLPVDQLYTNQVMDQVYQNGKLQLDKVCPGSGGGTYTPFASAGS